MSLVRYASKSFLSAVLCVALITSGCPTAQQWFDIVGALLPIIGQTYLQFYGFASKNGVDPAEVALVQNLSSAGQDAITRVEAIVAAVKGSPDQTKLGEAKAVLAQLQQSVDSFLADAQIKNSAHFEEYSGFAHSILADVTDVIALIPIFAPTPAGFKGVVVTTMPTSYHKAKGLKAIFSERLSRLPK